MEHYTERLPQECLDQMVDYQEDCLKETDQRTISNHHNKDLGKMGEDAAVTYLQRRGYEIVARNWVCHSGEADIIAMDADTLVFIEVKTRTSECSGLPEEAITRTKRSKYEKIAISYLTKNVLRDLSVRFDVISITVIDCNRAFLRHHINAFGTGD